MNAVKKKSFWIILIVIVLIIVAFRLIVPKDWETSEANLTVTNRSDTPIGSVSVSYARRDGSSVSEGALNADGSMIEKGDTVWLFQVSWPAIVTVYSDLESSRVLTQIYIEEAPEPNCRWKAEVYDLDGELSVSLTCVPKE